MNRFDDLSNYIQILNGFKYSNFDSLYDSEIITSILPDRISTTKAISELFDIEDDLYIAYDYESATIFNMMLYNNEKTKTIKITNLNYVFIKTHVNRDNTIMNKIADILSVPLDMKKFHYQHGLKNKSFNGMIWIDVGHQGMYEFHNVIYSMINQIKEHNPNVKFIIT